MIFSTIAALTELKAAQAVSRELPTFVQVFEQCSPVVWRAMRRLGVREADIEDACQEVFVVVHRKLPEFEGRSSVKTWVYGIAVRVASDFRKRAHVRHETPTEDFSSTSLGEGHTNGPGENAERRAALRWLDGVLANLDAEKRDVFVLYEVEQLTIAEIAEATGAPLQTTYSRLQAAKRFVDEAVKQLHQGAPPMAPTPASAAPHSKGGSR